MAILSVLGDSEGRVFFYLDNVSFVKLSMVSRDAGTILGNDTFFKNRYQEQESPSVDYFVELQKCAPNTCWKIACCLFSHGIFLNHSTLKCYVPQLIEKYKIAIEKDLQKIYDSPQNPNWNSDASEAFGHIWYSRMEDKRVALELELKDLKAMDETTAVDQIFKKLEREKNNILKCRFPVLVENLCDAAKDKKCIESIVDRIRTLISAHSEGEKIWKDLYEICAQGAQEENWAKRYFQRHLDQLNLIFQQHTWNIN